MNAASAFKKFKAATGFNLKSLVVICAGYICVAIVYLALSLFLFHKLHSYRNPEARFLAVEIPRLVFLLSLIGFSVVNNSFRMKLPEHRAKPSDTKSATDRGAPHWIVTAVLLPSMIMMIAVFLLVAGGFIRSEEPEAQVSYIVLDIAAFAAGMAVIMGVRALIVRQRIRRIAFTQDCPAK